MTEVVPLPAVAPPDGLHAVEARVLAAACTLAREGVRWDEGLARCAVSQAGLSKGEAALLMPQGARDLAVLLWKRHDTVAAARLLALEPAALKVRERIRTGVLARLDAAMADRSAVEAASRFLARPGQAALALRLGWETADGLWRWAGDTATDANHYSKRALLWGVLASTLAVRLARGETAAERHLDARLADVMRIETWKAKLPPVMDGLTVLAAQLGRLRYAARTARA